MSTWMVVEDEPDLYDTLIALFEIWSIDGVAFTNGTDAIKWIDDVDKGGLDVTIPELAILDIRLPGASGPDIGQRMRASRALGGVTIVLTTAYHLSPQEEKDVIARAGADTLLYKPLPSPSEFRSILQKTIDGRAAALAARRQPAAEPAPEPAAPDIPAEPEGTEPTAAEPEEPAEKTEQE